MLEDHKKLIENALIHAMDCWFILRTGRHKAYLKLVQHPDYRTALYPVLDVYGKRDERAAIHYAAVGRSLLRSGITMLEFWSSNTFHNSTSPLEFIQRLIDAGFSVTPDNS